MLHLLIILYSSMNGIDQNLAFQMARIESGMNPYAISKTNDGGLFQLNRKYYRFHNPNMVFQPDTNVALAMNTLRNLKNKCKHKMNNSFILCYNLGIQGAGKIKFPFRHEYYRKVNSLWRN